jgi:hypothetical protein
MKNITIDNKNFSKYEDIKGNMFLLNTVQLLTRVDYIEYSTEKVGEYGASDYEKAVFNQSIAKLEYPTKEVKRPVPKSDITGKDEDKFTLTDKKEEVVQIWQVSNNYGAHKEFTTKKNAIDFANRINSTIRSYLDKE